MHLACVCYITRVAVADHRLQSDIRFSVQLYGCNVLNLGNSRIISVNADTARQIVRDPHFHGDVQVIDYSPITSMYGAVHCSSQVVRRMPSSLKDKLVQDAIKRKKFSSQSPE